MLTFFFFEIEAERKEWLIGPQSQLFNGQNVTWYGLFPFCGVETNKPLLAGSDQYCTIALLHDMAWHGVAWRGIAMDGNRTEATRRKGNEEKSIRRQVSSDNSLASYDASFRACQSIPERFRFAKREVYYSAVSIERSAFLQHSTVCTQITGINNNASERQTG